MNLQHYKQQLKNFIDLEHSTQTKNIQAIWKMPLAERVQMGEAIANITVHTHSPHSSNQITLSCPLNISKFRKGSKVRLHRGNPNAAGANFPCEILKDLGTTIIVKAGFQVDFSLLKNGGGYILDNDLVDVKHILDKAVDDLSTKPRIYRMIHGEILPNINAERLALGQKIGAKAGMNEMQQEAFAKSLATDNFYVVQGPPGTGKTWVLSHLATTLAEMGEKVLITAFTHRAINNALKKIKKATQYERIAKIGPYTRSDDLEWENGQVDNYEYLSQSPYSNLSKGVILGGTCFSARTRRLGNINFDTIIFDEAGQMTLPLGIAGMLSANKYIFIGDHMQMSPVIVAEHPTKAVQQSIFETLFQHTEGTMLNTTYRMNQAINQFPSAAYYHGKLIAANPHKKLSYPSPPQRFAALLSPDVPSTFLDLQHQNRGVRSEEEAHAITELIATIIATGFPKGEIAVIAPYRAQGRLIRETLRKQFKDTENDNILDHIIVDTVERMQGQERDIIIISLTTSDPQHAAQRAAFYFQPNRMNVALTRPRYKRIVVGSSALLQTQTASEETNQWVQSLRAFYKSCTVFHLNENTK